MGELLITKRYHDAQLPVAYSGRLAYADETKVVAYCTWSLQAIWDLGPFSIVSGDTMVETFYHHEWFNVFAIYRPTGQLKGWYCNITTPTDIDDGRIEWHDLALDLLVLPDGHTTELDRAEFEEMTLDAEMRVRANGAMETLRCWVHEGRGPFAFLCM